MTDAPTPHKASLALRLVLLPIAGGWQLIVFYSPLLLLVWSTGYWFPR